MDTKHIPDNALLQKKEESSPQVDSQATDKITDMSVESWNGCITDQFPISNLITKSENMALFSTGSPHQGYSIFAHMENGVFDGSATIRTPGNLVIAKMEYTAGAMTGPCELYYQPGKLFFKGYLKNGCRRGKGTEYDMQGNVVFEGYFDENKKMNLVPFKSMPGKYWKIVDTNNQVQSVCQFTDLGDYYGICYFFDGEQISRVSLWKEGKEVEVLKKFKNNVMVEYKNGIKVYEGEFLDCIECNYPRNGTGTEYGPDGNTILFQGMFKDNEHNGMGVFYKNGKPSRSKKTEWIMGSSLSNVWIVLLLKTILPIVLVVVCHMINLGLGVLASILMVLFLLLHWAHPKYHGKKINALSSIKTVIEKLVERYYADPQNTSESYKNEKGSSNRLKSIQVFLIFVIIVINISFFVYHYINKYYGGPFGIKDDQISYYVENGTQNSLKRFTLTNYPNLKIVEIGDDCFGSVTVFTIDGLSSLSSLHIGSNSFTALKDGKFNMLLKNRAKSFHVINCKSLQNIVIGPYSFSDFAGGFELKYLDSLQYIDISKASFRYTPFVIQGIDLTLLLND